jgi:hypothetical protein
MDNMSGSNPNSRNINEPIPFDSDTSQSNVSHAPLDFGGGAASIPKIDPTKQVIKKPMEKASPVERITGVKTFFAKLHPGAIAFLDDQITRWLTDNPHITIKRTNIITGEIQSKVTEPNIIVTVWY